MQARAEFGAALVVQILGAAAVVLISTREWQTVTTPRARPFTDDVLGLTGRTVDGAPLAFALVALAGVVAVLATKGVGRRAVGVVVALAGGALVWRCAAATAAVPNSRARALVRVKHPRVIQSEAVTPHVTTHPLWGALSVVGAVLVLLAGVTIAIRGGRWSGMSNRYETPVGADPTDAERLRASADASLWTALERGEDPTALDPRDGH